jgi:hypothetical protein
LQSMEAGEHRTKGHGGYDCDAQDHDDTRKRT